MGDLGPKIQHPKTNQYVTCPQLTLFILAKDHVIVDGMAFMGSWNFSVFIGRMHVEDGN